MTKSSHNDAKGWKRGLGSYSSDIKLKTKTYVTPKGKTPGSDVDSRIDSNQYRKAGFAAKLDKV